MEWSIFEWKAAALRGYCTLNLKLACFVCSLKITNTFFNNNKKYACMHFKVNCLRNSKNGIEILVGQAVFKLWIKTVEIIFWSITLRTQELPGLLKCLFFPLFLGQFAIRCIYYFSKRRWSFWDRAQNILFFGYRCSPLNVQNRSPVSPRH